MLQKQYFSVPYATGSASTGRLVFPSWLKRLCRESSCLKCLIHWCRFLCFQKEIVLLLSAEPALLPLATRPWPCGPNTEKSFLSHPVLPALERASRPAFLSLNFQHELWPRHTCAGWQSCGAGACLWDCPPDPPPADHPRGGEELIIPGRALNDVDSKQTKHAGMLVSRSDKSPGNIA